MKVDNAPDKFELKLANGKSRSFKSGYDMWRWAMQNDPKLECNHEEKNIPSLSEWFERRNKK